jgi:PAS domain-containing protein
VQGEAVEPGWSGSSVAPPPASERIALLRLRGILDELPAAVALLRGPDHVFEFVNEEYRRLVSGAEVLGRSVEEALPEVAAQGFVQLLDDVFRTGDTHFGRETPITLEHDGWTEDLFLDFTYQPVHGADGGIEGILVFAVDVTVSVLTREQVEATERRLQENRFRRAIDSMIDTVVIGAAVTDDDGRVVDFTVEFINAGHDEVGRREARELLGRRFTELWPNVASSGLLGRYVDVVETGEPLVVDQIGYTEEVGGEELTGFFDIRATRLQSDLFLVWRDVTERVERDLHLKESEARLRQEHQSVTLLQEAILPRELPLVTGADVAAEYLAASHDVDVGGDWFDVLPLPDGRTAIAIGDVAGKGIHAAQTMAHLRTGGRVAALAGHDAAGVLAAQNALMGAAGLGPFATAIFAVYDPGAGTVTWASAGHLPPLLIRSSGATFQEVATHPPLGIEADPGYEVRVTTVGSGDRLVLYTDGLVERRGESIVDGLERLRLAAPSGGTAKGACAIMMEALGAAGLTDDVCILTLDPTG